MPLMHSWSFYIVWVINVCMKSVIKSERESVIIKYIMYVLNVYILYISDEQNRT